MSPTFALAGRTSWTCGCQLFGHLMRPARTHGSAHQVDLGARPSQPTRPQPIRQARVAAPAPRHDADGARCNARRTRPTPTPAVGVRRSASGPAPPAAPCPPTAPHRRWPAGPHRRAQHLDPLSGKDRIERDGDLVSRSRTRNLRPATSSPIPITRLRACCAIYSPTGCGVTPSTRTRRVATSIANRTYSRRSNTVSTVQESPPPAHWRPRLVGTAATSAPTARVPDRRRRALQDGPYGAGPILLLYPRRHSSPWMRRYPRSGSPWPAAAPARAARSSRQAGHAGGVGPPAPDQVPMPAQQRGRLHEQAPLGWTWQQPHQSSQYRPVGPVDPRPGHLASQHRDLVAQHQQFGVLGRCTPRQQGKPAHHLAKQQIEQSKSHVPIIMARQRRWRTRSSAPTTDFLAPTRCSHVALPGFRVDGSCRQCHRSPPPPAPKFRPTEGRAGVRRRPSPARRRPPWRQAGCPCPRTGRAPAARCGPRHPRDRGAGASVPAPCARRR
jgi:hypothetical protein